MMLRIVFFLLLALLGLSCLEKEPETRCDDSLENLEVGPDGKLKKKEDPDPLFEEKTDEGCKVR